MNNNSNDQPEFFFGDGDSRRDEGMDRVARNNKEWIKLAILCLHQLPPGWKGLPEDWRFAMIKSIGYPTNEHAWGALTRIAIERGLVRRTGVRRKMQARKSNSRDTAEYERP